MKTNLNDFLHRLPDFARWDGKKQTDHFAYFLTVLSGNESFDVKTIRLCFHDASTHEYGRVAQYLSEQAGMRGGQYVKKAGGYALSRSAIQSITDTFGDEPKMVAASQKLTDLLGRVKDSGEQAFLNEAIDCYRVQAFRAAIVMTWILTMDHMQKVVFASHLPAFNNAFLRSPDRKLNKITVYDDFGDVKESKVIELMRSANIISNDVRKILDEKLGIRNSAGHPSGVVIDGHKATEFILDLVNNVLLKY
jgi:hypothetical protein